MARKSGMSKRQVIKRSTSGSYLDACRRGKRHVTPRKQNQYVPNNGIKTDSHKVNSTILRQAAARAAKWQDNIAAGMGLNA